MGSPAFQTEHTLTLVADGNSQKVSMSTTSAASTAINAPYIVVTVDAACYARASASPTALGTGVDQYLIANKLYRFPWIDGYKIAFITLTGTGTAYITPGA